MKQKKRKEKQSCPSFGRLRARGRQLRHTQKRDSVARASHPRGDPGSSFGSQCAREWGEKKGMVNGNGTRSEYRNRTSREGKHCIDIKHYANGSGGARQAEWKGMETVIVITKSNSTRGRVEAWQRPVAGACEKNGPGLQDMYMYTHASKTDVWQVYQEDRAKRIGKVGMLMPNVTRGPER